jgi:GNAT superfamily N-acetyltransferase
VKIITIHGIRTKTLPFLFLDESPALTARGAQIEHFEYGYMSLNRFLNPYARKHVLRKFLEFYDEKVGFKERPSIVCHSFGTWILTEAIRMYPEIRFERAIMFGSILSPDLDLSLFFSKNQLMELLHEVGRRDWVVPLSKFALGKHAGKSGKLGFEDITPKYRPRIRQEFYDKFSHSDAAFLKHHIEQTWVPFLLEQPYKVRKQILGDETLTWMQPPSAPEGIAFPRRTYHCRIDRLGNYFAAYGAIAKNTSHGTIQRIPIHLATSSPETLVEAQFTVHDENRNPITFDALDDSPHRKAVEVLFNLDKGKTFSFYYYFRLSKTIRYSGDIDFFDCRNTEQCEVSIDSFYRLTTPQVFTIRNDRLIDRVAVEELCNEDKTYTYKIAFENRLSDDGLVFYFEGHVNESTRLKLTQRTDLKTSLGQKAGHIRNIREEDITSVSTLERQIEGRDGRAMTGDLMDRVRMFPDGFLLAVIENRIVGYIETVLWKSRNFRTFEEIKRFPLFFDRDGDELYVIFVATVAAERRIGIATALLEACKEVGRRHGVTHMRLVASASLLEFYEKRGFARIGPELPNFVDNIEGLLMVCSL